MHDLNCEPAPCTVCGSSAATCVAEGQDYLHQSSHQTYRYVQCDDCAHFYLSPRPTIDEIARMYPADYTTFSGELSQSRSPFAWIKDKVLVRRFAGLTKAQTSKFRLLDVGCGDAQFLLALRSLYSEAELAGLDWNFGAGIEDRMKAASVASITGTIECADLPEAWFDIITMNQLIEHVWDVPLVLERCLRALKPGGVLSIETPNPNGWDRKVFGNSWGGYYWPRHLNLFTKKHLARSAEKSGFVVASSSSLLAPPCLLLSLRFSLQRRRWNRLASMISDTNVLLLAAFAFIDRSALALGLETSNQKLIVRKPVPGQNHLQAATTS